MKFTIAICTWNGAQRMVTTLESIASMQVPASVDWEVLVVNNNSTDNTTEVCLSFGPKLPIRVVDELQQGHSWSRNCAMDHARGRYLVWTDDDVKVNDNWLAAYDAASQRHPDAVFFGGRIIPYFDHSVPAWVTDNPEILSGVFAERDLGDEEFLIETPEQLPYGANFVTRLDVQKQYRYDPKFGRVATGVKGFDEIDVLGRILSDGYQGYWIPDSGLQHLIPESRTTLKYLTDFYFGQGQTWVERGTSTLSESEIRKKIRRNRMRMWWLRLGSPKRWLPILTETANLKGQLSELRSRNRAS